MPQGNNSGENTKTSENRITEQLPEQSDIVQKAFDDVQTLKEQIERLKAQAHQISEAPAAENKSAGAVSGASTPVDTEAARAAEEAVKKQADKKITDGSDQLERERLARQAEILEAKRKEQEAKARLAQKKREHAEKQKALQEAEKRAARMTTNRRKAEIQTQLNKSLHIQEEKRAELRRKRDLEKQQRLRESLEREKLELQRKEETRIEKERERLEREREKLARKQAVLQRRDEARKLRLEEQKKKEEFDRLVAEQREITRKQREERAELKRKRRLAKESAELGGGIVNVHGTTVQTEIKPVPAFSIAEFLGISKRKEINAAQSEEEKQNLLEESQRIKEEARATAAQLREIRKRRRQNGRIYQKARGVLAFCDERKRPLILAFSTLLVIVVGTAGIFNYFTAYEYSYGDKKLGYVKNKDVVLQITDMVQSALTQEKDMTVVLDARNDISFRRVFTGNKDIVIDTQDGVLQRLSYMGDINVKAFGMYVDGQKVGAVKSKDIAAEVFKDLQNKYANHDEGTELNEAVIVENVEVRKSNTPMSDILNEKEMLDKLCTDTEKETVHTVERGETLDIIAENHNVSKEQIIADNANISGDQLQVGSTIVLRETAPLLTVRITETRTYEEKTDYKTIKKKDDELYEGETEIERKGKKGTSSVIEKTVSINGEVVESQDIKREVEKEPVDKIVLVGTKEKPPTTGTGTYIWPAYDGTYTVTSEFKWRWGRKHEGIDMGCSTGNDVLASDGGTVTHAGPMGGYGNLVIIDHENGIETYYAHNSSIIVSVGDKVFQGQHIAEAGNTGHSFGSHIHFGVKVNGTFENPRNYLPEK